MKNQNFAFAVTVFAVTELVLGCFAAAAAPAQDRSPNVVVILTDDQGWGDLSVNGNTNLATPHIDSLARDGATLENFYVCQVCAPTRAEFLTGRYHPRTGVSGVSRGDERLNSDETTIADVFRDAGYATGAFGKWHNGTQSPYHPNDRGFDEYYGFTSGHWGHYFSPPLDHNGRRVRGDGFIVDDFTNHAIDFIRDHREQPFFCYLPLNTPHSPMMVPDRFYAKFAGASLAMRHRDPQQEDLMMTRAALAMVENIDWNVGRLLQTLGELNLSDDTIVVFFSDNGPNSDRFNGGLKGRKGSIDEGGLRSPFFIRWPGRIAAGVTVTPIAGAIDLLPTLTELAGIPCESEKPLDGKSLKPLLDGDDAGWSQRVLFATRNADQVSVRNDRFRLDAAGRLFDLDVDRGQHHDVAAEHPEVTQRLTQLQTRHAAEMAAEFAKHADRPFTVGYGPVTPLPARDGIEHGTIRRSAKPPNNSFFTHWTDPADSISWQVDVVQAGHYEAIVHYTCAEGDQGVMVRLTLQDANNQDRDGRALASTQATVDQVFDPPLYDKSKERVADSHYFVKDFRPLSLGTMSLPVGRGVLRLSADQFQGPRAIDVHSIELIRR